MRTINAIQGDVPDQTKEIVRQAIMDFPWSNYGGFDVVEMTMEDPDPTVCQWVDDLAELIDKRLTVRKIIIRIQEAGK